MPRSGAAVAQRQAHRVVADGVLHAHVAAQKRGHYVVVRGAIVMLSAFHTRLVHYQRHANLVLREVRRVAPVVLVVLVILLSVVASDDYHRVLP